MSGNVTLDRIDFEKLKQQARRARADYMRECGTALIGSRRHIVSQCIALLGTHQVITVVAVLLISFGVKMFFLSAPTADAGTLRKMKPSPTATVHTNNNWIKVGEPPNP